MPHPEGRVVLAAGLAAIMQQEVPTALTEVFFRDSEKVKLWKAFLTSIQLPADHVELEQVGRSIAEFLLPVINAPAAYNTETNWLAGKTWQRA